MKNPIIYRYVTTGWLKIVSFFKTIFNAKSSDGKSGRKIASKAAANFDKNSQLQNMEITPLLWEKIKKVHLS